jgi:predicted  nucleic acid-binding Zn-ribbon protein
MAKKVEFSVEDRLRALYDLQLIHSRIDKIRSVRGELPLEVEDLEDEVAGLEVRISKLEEDSKQFTDDIKSKEIATEHAKTMIKKYNEQQKNVRNNRAFESLSKEIELKKQTIEENNEKLNERKEHLKHKKNELGDILKETEKEEGDLLKKSSEYESKIDESLLISYKKIRSSVRNGLAVVAVERGASAGSFFTIPPQVQLDIASRKKFITDEHSGRILVDKELAEEENEKMAKLFTSI